MRKWIYTAVFGAAALALGLIIWQLDLPNWQKLDLARITEIPESTIVFDADGNRVGTIQSERERKYTPLSEIPQHVQDAFITAEDQRFYEHSGVDIRRIFGALWHDLKTMSLDQGASTITQQLIKLTHLSSEKTLSRKVQEAMLARKLERRMDKSSILEAYLNTVYFGSGAYGIGTAAETYFGKPASELSLAEGALLAGIIKSPSNYAPHLKPENALKRRDMILQAMRENAVISETDYAQAAAEPLKLDMQTQDSGQYSWYMDQVLSEAGSILEMDAEEILSAGLRIHTGLDTGFQAAADNLFANGANFPDHAPDGTPVQAALVALDTRTGEIAAIIGGREYEVQRGLNRATQMQRQPGSAIKPVSSYAAAIEYKGFLPSSMVQDVQREFPGKYLPGNAGGSYYGTVTLREALSRSLNVATVDLADLIGMQNVRSAIASFGIPLAAQDVNLSLALGSMTHGVSPAKLCAAYCALANGGMQVQPHAIRRITDARGKVLYEAKQPHERAVSAQTAFLVTDMLKTAASEGSAKALSAAGIPVMGKTGTVGESGGGNRDIWTAAATPELAVTVWMGFDEPGNEHILPDYAGGSSYPAQMCAAFLKKIAPQLSGADFQAPDGIVPLRIDRAALSESKEILLAAQNTPDEYVLTEWFRADSLPTQTSALWNAPAPVNDLALISGSDEPPTLAFTAQDSTADYLVLRKSSTSTEIVAVLTGNAGDLILWTDTQADKNDPCSYSILPRHRLLYECGSLLTGPQSEEVEWPQGGLLERIFGR